MPRPQTENTNMNILLKSGWVIGPVNFQLYDVAPPPCPSEHEGMGSTDPDGGL